MEFKKYFCWFDRWAPRKKKTLKNRNIFLKIFEQNAWGSDHSRSGPGSVLEQTRVIRSMLPSLLQEIAAQSLLDVPCGDCNWINLVPLKLDLYIGGDIVPDIIRQNRATFKEPWKRFEVLDITADSLPKCDVIFCRDCLVHLSFAEIHKALRNFKLSGATYLLTTSFPSRSSNNDIETGDWRPLNLQASPFCLPPPIKVINEGCTENDGIYFDKSLMLWRIADL